MVWALNSGSPEAQFQRRYVGHYVDNIRNGKGKMTYPNGDKYTGKDFKYLYPLHKIEIFYVSNLMIQYNSFNRHWRYKATGSMEIDLEKVYIYIQKLVIVIKVYLEFISLSSMLSFC